MKRQVAQVNAKARQWRIDNPELAKAYSRETAAAWREANREYDRERMRRYPPSRADFQRRVREIKLERGCQDCGYRKHPEALEFDHREPSVKLAGIASMVSWHFPWEAILQEIMKCDVVCANCHRIRTVRRRGDESDAQ